MASLKITNVKKAFGSAEVLKGITLRIESGELLVLVGPSGCGKSTLLNLIAGLESITSGEIKIGDRVVNNIRPKDRDIAMVFQSYALYPNMNVRKNLAFGLETRRVPRAQIEETIQKVANVLQISELLDRKPSQLSGGQRQRVAMGRALARNPAIFLFDEPLSNLDAKLRVEMRTEIKLLHQRIKTTIVYVTHDQIEAMTLADRIAIMKDGTIQQFDTPHQIYENPSNLFVAGFIGSPSMNFIPCRIATHDQKKGVFLETGNGRSYFLPIEQSGLALDPWIDREVILGIRPEMISHGFAGQKGNPQIHEIESVVKVLEPTGPDTLVFVNINGKEVTCRANPSAAKSPGELMKLMVDMSKTILFDPQTEELIGRSTSPPFHVGLEKRK
jgi:multiple sugar transport system ATP-binding protein